MTHLRIEQNTTPEIVTSNVIHKLYETAKAIIDAEEANEVEESQVSLKGNLQVSKAYGDEVDWLEAKFPDLHITAGARYIRFADDAVYARLSQYLGDGTGITSSEITNANIFSSSNDSSTGYPYFQNNTSITSFNELGQLPQVTTIPNNAFYSASSLTSIDLSNITSLGTQTFMGCAGLTSVDLSNVTRIGNGACFTDCTSLASVTFPNIPFSWATNINEQGFLFTGCTALTQADISNATTVGKAWFRNCYALTEVDWPATVTTIPQEAFYDCYNLESLGSKIIPVSIGSWAFYHCRKITSDDIDFSNCKYIGGNAFDGCTGLTSVDLSSLTQIDNRAFKGCTGITSVDLSSCTTFGSKPFEECTNLTTITLSNSLTTLPAYALSGCTGLTTINGGSNIASYGEGALENCSSLATTIDLSNTTSIASKAFKGCSSVTFSNTDNVATFGDECFQKCNQISSFEFKDGVNIGMESFRNCAGLRFVRFKGSGICHFGAFRECSNLSSITFDSDIKLAPMSFGICSSLRTVDLSNISETSLFTSEYGLGSQFAQCFNLESVTLNTNITKLPQGMFSYCGDNLVMTIPSGVTEIGAECFYGTRAVLTVLATTPPTIDHNNTLISVQSIKVPAGTLSAYQSAPYWSDKASVITELAS